MNSVKLGDKHIRVDDAEKGQGNDYESTIFIGNMPWVTTEEEIREHFKECGHIVNVRIIRD